MSRIKFSLVDSYLDGGDGECLLTFTIHEQDLLHRRKSTFLSSNGIFIINDYYPYITKNKIYLRSDNKYYMSNKGFESDSVSIKFPTYDKLKESKERIILALKEWSLDEIKNS